MLLVNSQPSTMDCQQVPVSFKKGPAAIWKPSSKVWEAIGNATDIEWSIGSYVSAITLDCSNVQVDLKCPCDVYLGGKFSVKIKQTGSVAKNLIRLYSFFSLNK